MDDGRRGAWYLWDVGWTASLYSCTGLGRGTPRRFEAWTLDLEIQNSRQRVIKNENLLWFRVQLSEYYNFGQIEPLDAALFWV